MLSKSRIERAKILSATNEKLRSQNQRETDSLPESPSVDALAAAKKLLEPETARQESSAVQLTRLQLKQFRCFEHTKLHFESNRVLIEGANGSGKTSLLEALHYLCYLRSFRTHIPQELVFTGAPSFFIKASFTSDSGGIPLTHEAQVGFQHKRRLVKIDDRTISSYKELLAHYRVVTLTEDDILLITGGPEIRRAFLDAALLLSEPTFVSQIRNLRSCIGQRNALLQDPRHSYDEYMVWTQQLWDLSTQIQEQRRTLLAKLEQETQALEKGDHGLACPLACRYMPKLMGNTTSLQDFLLEHPDLHTKEKLWGRTLFGAHLDDISLTFQEKRSKAFASRGQQKLIALMLKTALIRLLNQQTGPKTVFLLDDFMTDFDDTRIEQLLLLLNSLENQLIFTCPLRATPLAQQLSLQGAQRISLTD